MSETKFTKGEWCIRLVNGQFAIIRHDTGYGICSTVMCDDTDKANAHLIAAAPEMYDLLDNIENDAEQVPEWLWDKIQLTLAKARGE